MKHAALFFITAIATSSVFAANSKCLDNGSGHERATQLFTKSINSSYLVSRIGPIVLSLTGHSGRFAPIPGTPNLFYFEYNDGGIDHPVKDNNSMSGVLSCDEATGKLTIVIGDVNYKGYSCIVPSITE